MRLRFGSPFAWFERWAPAFESRLRILTVNAGSSSLRVAAFDCEGSNARLLAAARWQGHDYGLEHVLQRFVEDYGATNPDAISHRVVHGGPRLTAPCLVDAAVEAEVRRVSDLAPLHNPLALKGLEACRALFGADVPQVAVFDTAFYATLPPVAATYALPREIVARHGVRRYGFHGLAHQAMTRRWRTLRPDAHPDARLVTLQLGAGCSITASRGGRAIDTSMGFSPLEGLVMATRSGDVDPGLLLYLQRAERLDPASMECLLNEQSGLLGVSGLSGDMRTLREAGGEAARAAIDLFCYRARKYVGAYFAALGGADAIIFGGGVGENGAEERAAILHGLDFLGIVVDGEANRATVGREACVSRADSRVEVWVIPVDEARILAEEAALVLAAGA
jgi:acetate kinase